MFNHKFKADSVSAAVEKILEARIPLEGHPYHKKSDEALRYIQKDAGQSARDFKGYDPKAEAKYLDQANDATTVLHHRKQGGVRQEEVEPIDEISKKTLGSYVTHAAHDAVNKTVDATNALKDKKIKKWHDTTKKVDKRLTGIDKASARLKEEEVEQIDELSSSTLRSYVDKSSADVLSRSASTLRKNIGPGHRDPEGDESKAEKAKTASRHAGTMKALDKFQVSRRREDGEKRAARRTKLGLGPANEEVEELDEISMETQASYWKKSRDDFNKRNKEKPTTRKERDDKYRAQDNRMKGMDRINDRARKYIDQQKEEIDIDATIRSIGEQYRKFGEKKD